jgi:hypothetical protein
VPAYQAIRRLLSITPFFCIGIFLVSCFKTESRTAIFDLRTKCSELSHKLVEEKRAARPTNALIDYPHYNASLNRCFLLIKTETTTDIEPNKLYTYKTVYDAQTDDALVMVSISGGAKQGGAVSTYGEWKVVSVAEANATIKELMEDETH